MTTPKLVDLDAAVDASPKWKPWLKPMLPFLKSWMKIEGLNDIYTRICARMDATEGAETNLWVACLRELGVEYEVSEEDLDRIPKTGPLFVVANHAYGAIDGLIMGAILTQARPDSRMLVNEMLLRVRNMGDYVFPVNVFGGKEATRGNLHSIKQTLRWLKSDGCVGTFPSGEVSHFIIDRMRVVDPAWKTHIASIIRNSGATVLPMYFPGRNSLLFQTMGMLHPRMRTMMLPREMIRKKNAQIGVKIGSPISSGKIQRYETDEELTQFLRLHTYILKNRPDPDTRKIKRFPKRIRLPKPPYKAIIPPVPVEKLEQELKALPADAELAKHSSFSVYLAKRPQIPNIMREIGRLREVTFREVGEGTGSSCDLDTFDDHYYHIFMWNHESREVMGAYRMGLTDEILGERGKNGLYTTTLFKLKPELLDELNPAIELGRSFIRSEYQRKHASLSLIWRGIGEYVARNPRYSYLFGPVSITAEYNALSKDLIVQFLKDNNLHPEFSKMVKARKPHRARKLKHFFTESESDSPKDINDISALISEIESDRKGIPILLKHYLKLNGLMLSFNRDPGFSNVIDGLILVDLTLTDPTILKRHLGDSGFERFMRYQEAKNAIEAGVASGARTEAGF